MSGMPLPDNRVELDVVRLGAAVDHSGQGQVPTGVDHLGNLGISAVFASAPLAEVGRDMAGFQAGGVHRGQCVGRGQQAPLTGSLGAGVEQGVAVFFFSSRRSA